MNTQEVEKIGQSIINCIIENELISAEKRGLCVWDEISSFIIGEHVTAQIHSLEQSKELIK